MFGYLLSRGDDGRCAASGNWRRAGGGLLASALLTAASATWALGLGDIALDSALNEKLDAEIELFDAEGLQPTEVIVSLASADDFARVGVERFFFLTDLRFEVAYGPDGVSHVEVSSTQPVTEPYLNFLVEVLWPSGRLLKEYTLLLDPPTFSPAPAPSVAAPSQSRQQDAGAGRVQREPRSSADAGTRVQLAPGRASEPSPLDDGVVDGEYRMTDRNDTLWGIAARTRPSAAVSVQQNMLAIQRLNPNAFLNDNINLLKAGYTLRLPTEQQALSLTDVEAGQQVAMQNEDWRALQRGETPANRGEGPARQVASEARSGSDLRAPVDATPRSNEAASERGPDGQLRIVAGAGDAATGGIDAATADALNAAREEQDRLGREVESLTEELGRERELASNQIAVKDRQIEVKDQQIADMQAELERLRQEFAQQDPATQSQNQSASAARAWWQSPYVMWGGVGVVVLLLVYGLIAARRRRAEADDFYPEVAESGAFDQATAVATTAPAAAAATVAATADDEVDQDERVLEFDDDDEPEASTTAADTDEPSTTPEAVPAAAGGSEISDVIGEADIYIAYGRYPQAIGLLRGVLEEDPGRNDVRLKLLELYAETRDREAFDAHMAELVERCDDEEALLTARELAQQFGDEPAPATDVPDMTSLEVDDAEALEGLAGADGGLELVEDDAPPAETEGAEDFELELDEVSTDEDAVARTAEAPGDDLGGDLGIDFDPERDREGNGEAAPQDLEAGNLGNADELELDLGDGALDDDALGDDAFDFEDEGDTASTKLDLARAYIDMGDQDGARDILNEVVAEGNAEQQQRAQAMLEEL